MTPSPYNPTPYDDDFEDQPGQSWFHKWILGLTLPACFLSYGIRTIATGHATYSNHVSIDLHGTDAVAYGISMLALGLFLHFHYFWGNVFNQAWWAVLGKILSAAAFIASTVTLIIRVVILGRKMIKQPRSRGVVTTPDPPVCTEDMKRFWALGCGFLAISLATDCVAGDWPQWRGPTRDGRVPSAEVVPDSLPLAPEVLWKIPIGLGVSSPIVVGGKVIYEDAGEKKEMLHVIDAVTTKELWSAEIDDLHKDSQTKPGPRCTPVSDGNLLWAQSSRGQLRCFNLADGKELWATNYVRDFGATYIGEKGRAIGAARHGYNGPPILDGDHLIALVGGKNAAVVCFDKKSGAVVWKSQDETPGYAAPVLETVAGKKQLVCFMAKDVIGIDPADGKLLWRSDVKTDLGRHVMTPVVVGDIVVVSSFQAGLIGIKVSREGDGFKAERLWTSKESASNFSCPVAVGQYLFALGPAKDLVCVDVATGKQMWAKEGFYTTGQALMSHAGMLVMRQNVLTLTDTGELVLFPGEPGGFHQISRVSICGKNWCNPAYAEGKLYLRDEKELKCVKLVP